MASNATPLKGAEPPAHVAFWPQQNATLYISVLPLKEFRFAETNDKSEIIFCRDGFGSKRPGEKAEFYPVDGSPTADHFDAFWKKCNPLESDDKGASLIGKYFLNQVEMLRALALEAGVDLRSDSDPEGSTVTIPKDTILQIDMNYRPFEILPRGRSHDASVAKPEEVSS
jgi:hypothetical protein